MRRQTILAAILAVAAGSTRAYAKDSTQVSLISAAATSETGESHAVSRLFDLDEATTWCAREKARVNVVLKLSGPSELATAHLALGDFSDWRGGPRVKQVYVTVYLGDEVVKKVRHKWPDGDDPREGAVTLDAPGDRLLVELDLVYAGQGSKGLCLSGLRIDGADGPVDMAPLAAAAWGASMLEKQLVGVYKIDGAKLELKKRGKYEYDDDNGGVNVEGKWKLTGGALELTVTKAKLDGKRVSSKDLPGPLTAPLRFGPRAEGDVPTFTPWFALAAGEAGLTVIPPASVVGP